MSKYLIFIALLFSTILHAQDQRPKIGVSLSGGGARGLAHIGVLKVLEEVGIQPDYITGVSMGSIVGGLYSMGYSADSIAHIFKSLDWDLILSDKISERKLGYEEKYFFRNSFLNFSLNKEGITFADGLISGHQISSLMTYYSWPANEVTDFDELPIPYRAVATDIVWCKQVTFSKGNIQEVMQASMAVPTVFTPTEIDTFLLIDGGLIRNFAVAEVKDLGADIVIGSYTGRRLYTKKELNTIGTILGQIGSFVGLSDSEEQKKQVDILITPEFEKISPGDFKKVDSIINVGYYAALPYKKQLEQLADSLNLRTAKKDVSYLLKNTKPLEIDDIRIEGNRFISDDQILKMLELSAGSVIDQDEMKEKMDGLYSSNLFSKISYHVIASNKRNILVIKCKEKSKSNINAFLHYDTYDGLGVYTSLLTRNFLLDRSRFTAEAYLGSYYRFRAEYLFYIGETNRWNTKFGMYHSKDILPAVKFANAFRGFNNFTSKAYLDFNYQIGVSNNFTLGMEYENLVLSPLILNNSPLTRTGFNNLNYYATYHLNLLDNYYFPRSGVEIFIRLKNIGFQFYSFTLNSATPNPPNIEESWIFPERRYNRLILRSRYFFPIKEKWSLALKANGVITFSNRLASNDFVLIGGPDISNDRSLPFYGFKAREFLTKNAVGGGLGVYYRLTDKLQFGVLADSYFIDDVSKDSDSRVLDPFLGFGGEATFNSIAGPIKLTLMRGEYFSIDDRVFTNFKFYVSIGFRF